MAAETGLSIRLAGESDLAVVQELYRHLNPADPQPEGAAARLAWRAVLAHPGLTVFLGELPSGAAVVSCTLVVVPNLTRMAHPYGLIENVVTHGDHRGKGYGKSLLDAAVAAAWAEDCYKVMLLTGSKRPETLRFYAGAGFEQNKTGFQIRRPGFAADDRLS
ncbi:GNAT family N-acetyltransferase [Thalassobaculum sp.]|uniref:GNAT family N-acetyltransferase n=1 Tax=Thalassobaculum sp. TaxID=2022740 RepID=UPI003B5C3303